MKNFRVMKITTEYTFIKAVNEEDAMYMAKEAVLASCSDWQHLDTEYSASPQIRVEKE